ncbi:MarR family winged helix-turn-helix transcriptional regulator [Kibdelosporangium aridum]|uniref:MarR family winged helix-turn-helix transcriptional regulator n=1 Tax=Kibdelosporangium aridum TaxID=2030 RepID=UPI0005278EA1
MADHVDMVLEQWHQRRPDLDVSPMGVIGRLNRVNRLISGELEKTFARYDLDRASFDVLATLRRSEPPHHLTPNDLVKSSMVTSGAVTQRLDRLEKRELVRRSRNEVDGRSVVVSLTDKGWDLINEVLPEHIATENRVLAGLTAKQRDTLAKTLRELLESLGDTQE